MSLHLLGHEVEFDATDGRLIVLPPSFWLVVGDGALWRSCDVLVAPTAHLQAPIAEASGAWIGAPDRRVQLPRPRQKWRKIAAVKEIRYTRPDQGGKFHPYEGARPSLWGLVGGAGYRVRLPDGCRVDALGFRKP